MTPQFRRNAQMYRTILITGAGSGFGEGTAIGLAKQGHTVIAAAQSWPQVTALRNKAESLGLSSLRVEKLDLLEPHDTARAVGWEFDVLVNNAGVGEGEPMSEIPLDLVRRNFEVNVFAPLDLTQRVVKRWVTLKTQGKIVFLSSILGVVIPHSGTDNQSGAILDRLQRDDGRSCVSVARRRGDVHTSRHDEGGHGRPSGQAGRTAESERYDCKDDRAYSRSERAVPEHFSAGLTGMVPAIRKSNA